MKKVAEEMNQRGRTAGKGKGNTMMKKKKKKRKRETVGRQE